MKDEEAEAAQEWARAESAKVGRSYVSQLEALRSKAKLWRRYRLLEWVCQGCGDPLLEVMDTEPQPVALYRQVDGDDASTGKLVRRAYTRTWFNVDRPLPAKEVTDRHTDVLAWCKCRSAILSGPQVHDDLRDGRPRRVIPMTAPGLNTPTA